MQFWKTTILAALTLGAPATAVAETVLTLHMEEQSAWVRNFNPFNQTSSRQHARLHLRAAGHLQPLRQQQALSIAWPKASTSPTT